MRHQSQLPRLSAVALCVLGAATSFVACQATASSEPDKPPAAWRSVSGKHTGSGVTLRYAVPDKMAVGETVTVRLQFSGISAAEGATVEVRDQATRATLLTLRLEQGEQRTVELPYVGRTDGMQFIDITTMQAGRATVQSVALRVGSGQLKLKAEGQRGTTASGEAVISLPAASPGASR